MPRLLVIADDLSGATDVGVQFAKQGIRALVTSRSALAGRNLAQLFDFHDVVLVDIESRHISPGESASRVTTVIRAAQAAAVEFFYKKTDSTLRGNVGAELEALLKASRRRTLCFIPAHPLLGRTTRDGIHFVDGRPLHESPFGKDARSPVKQSVVSAVLAEQTMLTITLVRQNQLNTFTEGPPPGIVLFDAETEADVRGAAAAIQKAGCLAALAGPAAFASCLPELIPFARERRTPAHLPPQLLVVNGSLNEVALRQCAAAREHGFASVFLTPAALLAENESGGDARDVIINETASLLARGHDVVLQSLRHRDEREAFDRAGKCLVLGSEDWPERIALNTGRIVAKILSERMAATGTDRPDVALVVFGGDTLAGIAQANGWEGFVPRDELLPGVALSEVPGAGLALISKPGGFGKDDVLLQLRAAIHA
jgi:D-threonate/D-erythronate kinase